MNCSSTAAKYGPGCSTRSGAQSCALKTDAMMPIASSQFTQRSAKRGLLATLSRLRSMGFVNSRRRSTPHSRCAASFAATTRTNSSSTNAGQPWRRTSASASSAVCHRWLEPSSSWRSLATNPAPSRIWRCSSRLRRYAVSTAPRWCRSGRRRPSSYDLTVFIDTPLSCAASSRPSPSRSRASRNARRHSSIAGIIARRGAHAATAGRIRLSA